jgi:short-subunit dehydrogenase
LGSLLERYGPVALVTGASSGIGAAFAEILAAAGLDLVLVARRIDRLTSLASELSDRFGTRTDTLAIDLGEADAADVILEASGAHNIGLLVSNAGFGFKGPHERHDDAALLKMLMVNCNAPMQLSRAFIPRLAQRERSGIILTSSIEALLGGPYSAAYAASKAFVKSLGEGLWAELTPRGIDVLTLCPGATDTEALEKQGIDRTKLTQLMPAAEVAGLALDNLANGPTFISSEHYRQTFDQLLALPRRDALHAMANAMLPSSSSRS